MMGSPQSTVPAKSPQSTVHSPQSPTQDSGLGTQDFPVRTQDYLPWTLRDLKDTRANLREAVAAAAFVPPGAKAMILEIIDQSFPQARLLSLDAHVHVFERAGKKTVNVDMTISEI